MAGEDVPSIYETTMTRSDGSKIDLEINAGIITYEGRPADLVMFRDITQRKRAEKALHESEERLRTLVERVEAIIFCLDPDLHPVMLAGRVERILGHTAQELVANPHLWTDALDPEDLSHLAAEIRAAKEGEPVVVDIRARSPRGTRWVRVHVAPRFDEQGELICYSGVATDVTDRMVLQERETRRAIRTAALAEISQALSSSLEESAILGIASERTGQVLAAVGVVGSVDPVTERVTRLWVTCPQPGREQEVNEALREAELTVRSVFGEQGARPVMAHDLAEVSPEMASFARRVGFRAGLIVPVYTDNQVTSILAAVRARDQEPFEDDDLWFLTEMGFHASAALANARLFRRQSQIAETLQRSLIPENPTVPGLDIATRYSPASADIEVGGDFLDVVAYGEGCVGIVVGDIAGKGLQAAVHTAETKYMLRAFAHANPEPGAVMASLNNALCLYSREFAFVTLFYGLLDTAGRRLLYVNAGQEIPVILRSGGDTLTRLDPNGTVLGVTRDLVYQAASTHLAPGDLLLCYTDGMTDVRTDGDRLGLDGLLDIISSARAGSARELLEHVSSSVRELSRGNQPDDQVVVVVRPVMGDE